jgi:hypothetical protein
MTITPKAGRGVQLVLATALAGLVAMSSTAFGRELPKTEEELIDQVRTAMAASDIDAFSDLVYWEGAPDIRRRLTKFQIRCGFGRKIRSIALEPFPEEGVRKIEESGTLKPNMPITNRLRVTFDEPAEEDGGQPASVFLIGKMDGAYRIALVVRAKRPPSD